MLTQVDAFVRPAHYPAPLVENYLAAAMNSRHTGVSGTARRRCPGRHARCPMAGAGLSQPDRYPRPCASPRCRGRRRECGRPGVGGGEGVVHKGPFIRNRRVGGFRCGLPWSRCRQGIHRYRGRRPRPMAHRRPARRSDRRSVTCRPRRAARANVPGAHRPRGALSGENREAGVSPARARHCE
jgi:hypothetical protein